MVANVLTVSIIALMVSVAALVISALSVAYTRRATHATEESAKVAKTQERRARTPQLDVIVEDLIPHNGDVAIYLVRNNGPQDLDSVVVHRPIVPEGVRHPVARTGLSDWQDYVEIGPLALASTARFTLAVGSSPTLPEFRVRIQTRSGPDMWDASYLLRNPRRPPPPRAVKARFT